jgi:Icc-related predicted phosphoesterase
MQAIVKKIDIPKNRRMIVTSDIHGHFHHLKNILRKVGFTKNDILFIVGDIIEKGPMSLKTLRYVMQLCKDYTVYPLIGNVDAARVLMFDGNSTENSDKIYEYIKFMEKHWGGCFFLDMCKELDIYIYSPNDIPNAKEQISIKFKEELNFLRNLPTIIETQNYIFVHGGIPSDIVDSFEGTDAFQYLKNDAFMEKGLEFKKYVVVGHWPVTLYNYKIISSNPIINRKQKIISIDGGCGLKRDGQLNALIISDIDSGDIAFEYYDDLPVAFAQTSQEKSASSINIRYTDNKIKILEKGKEFSFAEHRSSGYRLWINNDYIYNFCDDAKCDDYTDYKIPVDLGDKLSIIKKTSKGYLVKKDGISGWYNGIIDYKVDDCNNSRGRRYK